MRRTSGAPDRYGGGRCWGLVSAARSAERGVEPSAGSKKDGVEQLIGWSAHAHSRVASRRLAVRARRAHVRNIDSLFPGWNENGSLLSCHMARFATASRQGNKDCRLTLWPWDYFRWKAQCRTEARYSNASLWIRGSNPLSRALAGEKKFQFPYGKEIYFLRV